MKPKQRDIWLVPIPFTDLSSTKRRPVVIISSDQHNLSHEDMLVAAMTSNLQQADYGVKVTPADLAEGILKAESMILPAKIYTLSHTLLIKRFGAINVSTLNAVCMELDRVIGR